MLDWLRRKWASIRFPYPSICCDGCGIMVDFRHRSFNEVNARVALDGWSVGEALKGPDYCPRCKEVEN